jgi:uncharacterized protein (DUF885 family)
MNSFLASLGINESTLSAGLAKISALPQSQPATLAQASAHASEFLAKLYADAWSADVWGMPHPPPMNVHIIDGTGSAFYLAGTSTMTLPAGHEPLYSYDATLTHEYTHYLQDLVSRESSGEAPVSQFLPLFGSYVLSEGGAHFAEVQGYASALYNYPDSTITALTRLSALQGLMLRAVRLVVDTGIHLQLLTRDEAIAYMKARLNRSPAFFESEVDRYESWPAQALSYRIGAEAIVTEQQRAQAALGSRFSAPAFDKMVLSLSGATGQLLTLRTDAFIAAGQ